MLYTRYRPTRFAELVGQETTAQILKQAVTQGKIAHSYLFTGPRGTGKTTTARLLAKIVNCQNLSADGDCCQKCPSCVAIDHGNYLDLIEIDAASNRGIDQIRELKERLEFSPSMGTYKVYIIDEVHMLTVEAFNALLKTLEEPPAHAIFILATTEPHRLPATILSRCQRFDFHMGNEDSVKQVIERVVKDEGYTIEPGAIDLLIQHSGGSYRDALSLLDVVVAGVSAKQKINEKKVRQTLGLVDEELQRLFLGGLAQYQSKQLLDVLKTLTQRGGNIHYFVRELIIALRDILWQKLQANEKIAAEWAPIPVSSVQQLIAWLLEADAQARDALFPTLPLELVVAKWLASRGETPAPPIKPDGQQKIASVVVKKKKVGSDAIKVIKSNQTASVGHPALDVASITARWPQFVAAVRKHNPHLYAFLNGGRLLAVEADDESAVLQLGVRFNFHKERIEAISSQETIQLLSREIFGYPLRIRCQLVTEEEAPKPEANNAINEVLEVFMGDLE